ncbi:hypothetical protein CTI12_AA146060 [Artemisia annua]|uniref:Uncharacterized protein n=1 Tax=Artemisia annua TaxID=35608 RepID=A0A2U1PJF2_ARTAN|nr:hypothetical protein CTI12_AA146060 [Artemisia annua]
MATSGTTGLANDFGHEKKFSPRFAIVSTYSHEFPSSSSFKYSLPIVVVVAMIKTPTIIKINGL